MRKKYFAVEEGLGYPSSHEVHKKCNLLTSSANHGGTTGSENHLPLEAALNMSSPNSMAPPLLKLSLNVPCPSQPPWRENYHLIRLLASSVPAKIAKLFICQLFFSSLFQNYFPFYYQGEKVMALLSDPPK